MSFFRELKRRNVFRVAAAYIIVAWLIMQAGDTLAPALRLPDWINSALAFFLILGFPLALFFAWAFEMTPEGLKKEKDVDRAQSITHATGQKLNYTIIALLVIALAYFGYDKFVLEPGRNAREVATALQQARDDESTAVESTEPDHSIAVLPFVDMSAGGDNAYFSDGLTEELLNMLAKISELKVAGRTSSFAFKGKDEDLRSIGEKLNVTSILEGSVRKDDTRNRVRITAQLINAGDGYHVWSDTYDRDLDDIFAIQEEIARKVAEALRITLLGEDEVRLKHVANTQINAYDLYLQGLQGVNDGGFAALKKATRVFKQALALDPTYTPAKLGLADAWTALAGTGAITKEEAVKRALPLLNAVLAEQADDADAQTQIGMLRAFEDNDAAADKAFSSALVIDPRNANSLNRYGRFLFDRGQIEHGMGLIAAALEIEPYSLPVLWNQCATNAYMQNLDVAKAACLRIIEIKPESPLGWYGLKIAYNQSGVIAQAMKNFEEAIQRDPGDYEMLAGMSLFWLTLGDLEQARQWLQHAEAIGAGQPIPTLNRISIYQYQERYDQAGDLAKRVLAQKLEDRYGTNTSFRQAVAFDALQKRDYQAALAPYRKTFPWAFRSPLEPPPDAFRFTHDIIQIAALLKLADPISRQSKDLLDLVEKTVDRYSPRIGKWVPDIRRAAIATVRGDHESALASLNKAWDKNWRSPWRPVLIYNVVFSQLQSEPGYQELLARFQANMERQRNKAYELLGITQ